MCGLEICPVLTRVVFQDNSAQYGGGQVTMTNVTFSGNRANNGGGINIGDKATPTLIQVTLSGDQADYDGDGDGSGGGINNFNDVESWVRNTILWGNTPDQYWQGKGRTEISDSVVQYGAGHPQGMNIEGTNIITADPRLGTPGDHGGLTETIPLMEGSSAIDAANPDHATDTDQRGEARPRGAGHDVGAYEAPAAPQPRATSTTIPSSANPSLVGQTVTFTAAVHQLAPAGDVVNGAVTFDDGTVSLGTITLSGGEATLSTAALGPGDHQISAWFGGSASFLESRPSSLTQRVRMASVTTLAAAPNPSVCGQSATLTTTVAPALPSVLIPTGTVRFLEGNVVLGTAPLSAGKATLNVAAMTVGDHPLVARYEGDALSAPSISPSLTQVVSRAAAKVVLTSSLNPANVTMPVTLTVAVSAASPGRGTPTGAVTILDGAAIIGNGPLSGGRYSLQTSSLTEGAHPLAVEFTGDGSFLPGSGGLSQTIWPPARLVSPNGGETLHPGDFCRHHLAAQGAGGAEPPLLLHGWRHQREADHPLGQRHQFRLDCAGGEGQFPAQHSQDHRLPHRRGQGLDRRFGPAVHPGVLEADVPQRGRDRRLRGGADCHLAERGPQRHHLHQHRGDHQWGCHLDDPGRDPRGRQRNLDGERHGGDCREDRLQGADQPERRLRYGRRRRQRRLVRHPALTTSLIPDPGEHLACFPGRIPPPPAP
jgi:hypothetical protein